MKILEALKSAIRPIGKLAARLRGNLLVEHVEDEPDVLSDKVFYVVGEGGHPWYGIVLCPCGCGEVIKLSMVPNSRPRWELVDTWDDTATLRPSVWRRVGCKSHFWLRGGSVKWC